jgi:hypothetical protein
MSADSKSDNNAEDRKNKAANELEAEIEFREEDQVVQDRAVQGDLNQGFDTGTTDSVRYGANWPASYRVRPSHSESSPEPQQKDEKKEEKP